MLIPQQQYKQQLQEKSTPFRHKKIPQIAKSRFLGREASLRRKSNQPYLQHFHMG